MVKYAQLILHRGTLPLAFVASTIALNALRQWERREWYALSPDPPSC